MELSMLCLNNDCLSHIFDHLELRDQLRLTAVCERFRDVILAVQWRSHYRRFSDMNTLSREELLSLYKLIAHRIEQLVIWDRTFKKWGGLFLHFEFPVLRRLECYLRFNEGDMQVLAAHCPLIEELYLHEYIVGIPWPHIFRMRHLRELHVPRAKLDAYELKQILTLPLTELRVYSFKGYDDHRSVAEVLIGASDLRVFRMHYDDATSDLMKSIIDLASITELRDPLTVYVNYGEGPNPELNYLGDDYYINMLYNFKDYKLSLQAFMDNQLTSSAVTILISKGFGEIEFRFFHQSNKK